jgi:hypothetical protein
MAHELHRDRDLPRIAAHQLFRYWRRWVKGEGYEQLDRESFNLAPTWQSVVVSGLFHFEGTR